VSHAKEIERVNRAFGSAGKRLQALYARDDDDEPPTRRRFFYAYDLVHDPQPAAATPATDPETGKD
jgi:hypothetical protein